MRCFLVSVLLLSQLNSPAMAQNPEQDSSVPYQKGLAALYAGKLSEADRWFEITARDFPKRLDGMRALVLQMVYRMAKELSSVRMAHHMLEGAKMELREQDKSPWQQRMRLYENDGLKWGETMLSKAQTFFQDDSESLPLKLELRLDTQTISVQKLRDRLTKGEMLDGDELRKLEEGEWLSNFLGLLGELLALPDNSLLSGEYAGVVQRPTLYRSVGARLFILWEKNQKADYAELAKRYFEKVLAMTMGEPYHSDRQKAQDFLARLETSRANPPKKRAQDGAKKSK